MFSNLNSESKRLGTHAWKEALLVLVAHLKRHSLATVLAAATGLLGIEVVLTRATHNDLTVLCNAKAFCI